MTPDQTAQRNPKFLFFLLIGLCLFFFVGYTNRLMIYGNEQAEIEKLHQNIEVAKLETVRLRAFLEYVQSDVYVEEVSHQELGYSRDGEKIVIILPEIAANETEASDSATTFTTSALTQEPVWRHWLLLFSRNR